jgi:hypothetical protein
VDARGTVRSAPPDDPRVQIPIASFLAILAVGLLLGNFLRPAAGQDLEALLRLPGQTKSLAGKEPSPIPSSVLGPRPRRWPPGALASALAAAVGYGVGLKRNSFATSATPTGRRCAGAGDRCRSTLGVAGRPPGPASRASWRYHPRCFPRVRGLRQLPNFSRISRTPCAGRESCSPEPSPRWGGIKPPRVPPPSPPGLDQPAPPWAPTGR